MRATVKSDFHCFAYSIPAQSLSRFRRPVDFRSRRNQCRLDDNFAVILAHSCKRFTTSPSDCLSDVPLQSVVCERAASECPCFVRESNAH
jgi:hypothetical protein